jgi:hypothetical protein
MADTKPPTGMPLPDAVAGNFQEAVRWFNQMWGGAMDPAAAARGTGPIPSVLMPTLDIKELDKRIGDLRSVEHWLQLNQGLLHTTIQGLEMQRNTLSAWQSFGAAATGAAAQGAAAGSRATPLPTMPTPAPAPAEGSAVSPAFQPTMWWDALQQQFAQMAAAAAAGDTAPSMQPEPKAGAAGAPDGGNAGDNGPKSAAGRAPPGKPRTTGPGTA